MKKISLKSWVKVVLVIFVLVILGITLKIMDDDFVDSCVDAGYSIDHCERVK